MLTKTPASAIATVVLLIVAYVPAAYSAPSEATKDRCNQYAQRAVAQYQLMTSHPQCKVNDDLRWQNNLDNHYNACVKLPEFMSKNEEAARDSHLQACAGLTQAAAESSASGTGNARSETKTPSLAPAIINETEAGVSGVWTKDAESYSASWGNGAVATLMVSSFTPASVVVRRTDTSASISAGLTAVYAGKISSAGNSIVDGTVTWTWPGVQGFPATGEWSATWAAGTPGAVAAGASPKANCQITPPRALPATATPVGIHAIVKGGTLSFQSYQQKGKVVTYQVVRPAYIEAQMRCSGRVEKLYGPWISLAGSQGPEVFYVNLGSSVSGAPLSAASAMQLTQR